MRIALLIGLMAGVSGCGANAGPEGPRGFTGEKGAVGKQGEPGEGFMASPAIASVFPTVVVPGQTLEISITGAYTEWTNGAIVSFGEGITVSKIVSPSKVALIATVTLAKTALPGLRDITVTQNGVVTQWKNAFTINQLYRVELLGKPGRGALAMVRIITNDPDFTFDPTWNGTSYLGVRVSSSPASMIVVQDVKPRQLDLLITGDVDSPLGMRDLRVTNRAGRPGEQTLLFPQLYDFADLAELTVTPGMTYTAALAQPFSSAEFKFVATGGSAETMASVTTTGGPAGAPLGHPMIALMTSQGKFTGTVALTNSYTFFPYSTPFYFVIFDPTGAGGFNYNFNVGPLVRTVELEPNDTKENAPTLTLPLLQQSSLSSATDVDLFKVVVTENEVGRHLRIRTRYGTTGSYNTDSKVELVNPAGDVFAGPLDVNYHEDLRTPALDVPGDWLVRISYGTFYPPWSTYKSAYELLVNWE